MPRAGQTNTKATDATPAPSGNPTDEAGGARSTPVRYGSKTNLNAKVLDFIQFGGPLSYLRVSLNCQFILARSGLPVEFTDEFKGVGRRLPVGRSHRPI